MKKFKNGAWVGGVEPEHNESFVQYIADAEVITKFIPDSLRIDGIKSEKISQIKREAGARISALDWKLTRADEQPDLYSKSDVINERQGIRDASNVAELAVNELTTIDEVKQFTW